MQDYEEGGEEGPLGPRVAFVLRTLVYVGTARGGLSKRGLSRRDLDLGPTASHRSPTPSHRALQYEIRLWYDIAVFVAVLSFHSARYRSDHGPRRPLEARVISARDLDLGSTASHTPITVLWYMYDTPLV